MAMRFQATMLLASLLTLGGLHRAEAQPSAQVPSATLAEPTTPAPATRRRVDYYGWQILLVDAASVTATIAAGSVNENAGFPVLAGGYLLGGPIVHLSHGNRGRALISASLRLGLPVLGAGLVLWPDENCAPDNEDVCDDDDLAEGLAAVALGVIGMGVASLVDWTVLGRSVEHVPVEPGPVVVPQVSAGVDGSLQIGVLGRF
jgi:hypothetical protein